MRKVNKHIFEKFLKEHKINKTQFCKNCGISIKTFNNLLNGKNLNVITAVKIAKYTSFKIQDMFSVE